MPATKQLKPQAQKSQPKTHHSSATPVTKTGGNMSGPISTLVERMGDARFAAAQRQAMATQTGNLLGNRTLMRVMRKQREQATPSIQRAFEMTSTLLTSSLLATHEAIETALVEKEPLRVLNQEIDALAAKTRKKSYFHEEQGKDRDELVTGLGTLRGRIPTTVVASELGLSEGVAKAIRQRFSLKLARIAPFYTQSANKNILGVKGVEANMRTCNITTIAMTLEGLGKTTADFQGSMTLMNNIVSRLSLGTTNAATLRLPDFLQILAIYLEMAKKNNIATLNSLSTSDPEKFQEIMTESSKNAATDSKTTGDMFKSNKFYTFTTQFGVSAQSHSLDLGPALAVFGEYYRPFDKELEAYAKKKKKKVEDVREEFTAKRKAKYRQQAAQLGKKIVASDKDLQKREEDIAAAKKSLIQYEEKLKILDSNLAALEKQITELTAQQTAATDKASQKDLKEQLSTVKASKKAKTGERKGLEKKKRNLEKSLVKQEKNRTKALNDQADQNLKQSASLAVGSETNEEVAVEETVPVQVYQSAVIPLMIGHLGAGKQIIVNMHNHFAKLQDLNHETITVHDPGGYTRNNMTVSWEDARKLGYFKRYTVVG